MNKTIKLILFSIAIFAISLILPNITHAATLVYDEESLNNAVSTVDGGSTITLQNDITVTKPIVIEKELIIDGNGHNVVGSNEWTSTSGNQTMFTAQFSNGKLTLKNINLKNGPKYGVQSYDGATVILDNVTITGFNYGGVLLNGGNVEVIDLHLGYNGTGANNGIEIDKGAYATNNPTLTMNGELTSDTSENVVRVAENGHLTEFTVTNTSNTSNKVVLAGNKVVLTDKNDIVVSESTVPEKATPNVDTKQNLITIFAADKTFKITVDTGKTIDAELLKSAVKLEENYVIDGFYTDADYTDEFNFGNPIDTDTTVYAKVSKIETTEPEENQPETTLPEASGQEKDETPKTGMPNYLAIAILGIVFSFMAIILIKRSH